MPSLFQSITSFFSNHRDGSHVRRDHDLSSIDDAFSVPPDAEYVSTPSSYTYPPPAQGRAYDTVDSYDQRLSPSPAISLFGSRARPASLLPLHHSPLSPLPPYPPLHHTWNRLRDWLDSHYPELGDTLNWGIPPAELEQLEMQLGFVLPSAVRESYLLVDGQEAESAAGCSDGLFYGLTLLSFEEVVDEWRLWREVDDDPSTGANKTLRASMRSVPPRYIRSEYSQRGWLPLVTDKAGNFLGVDLSPDEEGTAGQVIVFGRDFDTKVVLWKGDGNAGWARWLASFVDELESGDGFEFGSAYGSDADSEDNVGYESYFFDGSGNAKGEGGGSGGAGGLHLTGQYKGWGVLEAFADRSWRRWIEAGVMPAAKPTPADSPGDLVQDRPDTDTSIAADATDESEPIAGPSSRPSPNGYSAQPPALHVRAPSISKLPAPKPVILPTEDDLLPSPTSPRGPVYDEDEEAGRLTSDEFDRTTPIQSQFSAPNPKEGSLVSLPSVDDEDDKPPTPPETLVDPQSLEAPSDAPSSDLLSDTLIDSTSPPQSSPPPEAAPHNPLDDANEDGETTDLDVAQPTIRLVGDDSSKVGNSADDGKDEEGDAGTLTENSDVPKVDEQTDEPAVRHKSKGSIGKVLGEVAGIVKRKPEPAS